MQRLLIFFLLLTGCIRDEQAPPHVLPKEQIVSILIDIHIAEAKANRMSLRSYDSTQAYYKKLERDIFKKHQVDTAVYRKSFTYYMDHMKLMDEIYTAVVDSLNVKEKVGKLD
jgi:3-hydroxyacyl-CoA dehydrogenase